MRKSLIIGAAALTAIGAAGIFFGPSGGGDAAEYRLATIQRGAIVDAVTATGTLGAVVTVEVGSQVSGQIIELSVDFNSKVKKGQIIARIDPDTFEANVRRAEADLTVAQANMALDRASLARSSADIENARASLEAAQARLQNTRVSLADLERDLNRKRELHERRVIAVAQVETAQAKYDQGVAQRDASAAEERAQQSQVAAREAQFEMAMAQIEIGAAQVEIREAMLYSDIVDLNRTVIYSPVDGVVVERTVDIGQTVAASLQAPKLFTIAQDLREMQVEISVDEADIGRASEGQRVTFTVDAFPGRTFEGRVMQIRLAPQTVQSVVTYTVIAAAANEDERLLPGMTADVRLVAQERQQALRLPNAALRFRPARAERANTAPTPANAANAAAALVVREGGAEGGGVPAARQAGVEGGGGRGGVARGGQAGGRADLAQVAEQLGLTQEQQQQIRSALGNNRQRAQALREAGVEPAAIRRQLGNAVQEAIQSVLTPEQLAAYQGLQAERAEATTRNGQVYVIGEDGVPQAVPVVLGISDGNVTEVLDGAIEPGIQVIIGIEVAEDDGQPTSTLRFGL